MENRSSRNLGWKFGRYAGARMLGLAALLAAPSLMAEDAAAPARAVRLSSVDGHVQISQGGQMIADPAVVNTPLFEGTQVVTSDDGRAEIQFEDGSVARLSPNSSMTLTVLNDSSAEISLDGGLGYMELQGSGQGHPQVRFSDAVVTASGYTVLRVSLDTPPGELAVFSGNAHMDRGAALALDIHGGESVALNADPAQYNLAESIEPDSWDSWNTDRDQVLNAEASAKTEATGSFINNSNPAWSDLDANGNWYNVPGQGYVWSPYDGANAGWDPYGNGYWMFNPRFGYMWVSGDSWGYMPFSCGMWNFYGGFGWGWAPGMGACSPWWGGGFYVTNIGYGPGGYLPPMRPHRPVHPGNPGRGNKAGPYPLIAVNKRPPSGFSNGPGRDRVEPVTIAGHVVQPLKPLSPRPMYDRSASAFVNHALPAGAGAKTPALPGAHPVGVAGTHPAPGARPVGAAPHPAAPSHAYSPPPVHSAPSGGGGGGGAHPSGGGGGSHH